MYNLSKAWLCCRDEAIIKYRQAAEGVKSLGEGRFVKNKTKKKKRGRTFAVCPGKDQEMMKYLQGIVVTSVDGKQECTYRGKKKEYFSAFAYLMGVCLLWSWEKEISKESR